MAKVFDQSCATSFFEQLTPVQVQFERLMMQMRTKQGASITDYLSCLSDQHRQECEKEVEQLVNKRFIEHKLGRYVFTTKGFCVEDQLLSKLLR